MLRNIGKKLKIVSGVMFIISVIGSVISSVCSISNRRGFSLVLTLVSLFFSYIICFVIYVFGYLYDYLEAQGVKLDRNMITPTDEKDAVSSSETINNDEIIFE